MNIFWENSLIKIGWNILCLLIYISILDPKTVIKITSFVFRTVIYSLIHFLDEKFHMCNGVKSCLNMWIILQDVECIILTANLYRLIFVLIRLQLRNIFTTLCFTLSLFSLCAWSVDWKVCFYEKKHMACYNFGPNAKKIGETIHLFEVVQKLGSNHSWSRISIISRFQKIFFNYGLSDNLVKYVVDLH